MSQPDRPRIGIDLGGTKIEGVLLDGGGTLLRSLRVATPRHDYSATVDAVAELVALCSLALTTRSDDLSSS